MKTEEELNVTFIIDNTAKSSVLCLFFCFSFYEHCLFLNLFSDFAGITDTFPFLLYTPSSDLKCSWFTFKIPQHCFYAGNRFSINVLKRFLSGTGYSMLHCLDKSGK